MSVEAAEPGAAPIGDAIRDLHDRDGLAFAIPAHRSGTRRIRPDAAEWTGDHAFDAEMICPGPPGIPVTAPGER
jgi:arginine/lysine/ornithine decarboxylase